MRHHADLIPHSPRAAVSTSLLLLTAASCSSVKLFLNGGEKQVKHVPRPVVPGPYVLIFGSTAPVTIS